MNTPPARSPHLPGFALLGLAVLTVAAVAWVSGGREPVPLVTPDRQVLQVRELQFFDEPGGAVVVVDTASGRVIHRVEGEAGFLRGVLRAMGRERKRNGAGPDAPFRIVAYAGGRLLLVDTATGESIELNSFGSTNAETFARLLDASGGAS